MNAPPAAANNPLLILLDFVASPLLLFGADGHVVFTNQAAKAMRCRPALLLGSDPHVKALVRDVAAGRTLPSLELRVEALSDDGIARLVCRSAPRPVAGLVPVSVAVAEVDALDASPVEAAEADHVLHYLEASDELCKARLARRNAGGTHDYQVSEADYDLFTSHFVPPADDEGFRLAVKRQDSI